MSARVQLAGKWFYWNMDVLPKEVPGEGQVVLLGYGRSNRAGWCCSGCIEGSPLKGGTLEK